MTSHDGPRNGAGTRGPSVHEAEGVAARLSALATELAEARGRFDAVLQALPVGVWITDGTGRVLETNAQADAIWAGEAPHSASPDEYREYRWPTGTSTRRPTPRSAR